MARLIFTVAVLLGLAVQAQPTYTHHVTPDGSATSSCTSEAPCSLSRASQFAFPAGSVVRVAAGEYSQGQLTFARSGVAGSLVTFIFEPGSRVSGTRHKPATWAPTPGQPHVFETTDCGVTTCAGVGLMAQRSPASWTPIRVDDRHAPFTVSLGRPFTLDIPPPFKRVYSVAAVEAQYGTYYSTADKVYVHTYHDAIPTAADDLYVAPRYWGSIIVTGDFLAFEGLTIEKVTDVGFHVRRDAQGIVIKRLMARAAQVWLEGWGTDVEDLDVSHVITQGAPELPDAYDANPAFGLGENWNSHATGHALLVGRGNATGTGQTLRRIRVHRSWNGIEINGRNTIDGGWVWGFPNHAIGGAGTGVTIRNVTSANAQDALFLNGDAFDQLTVEHNAFINGVLVTSSYNGRPVGTPPTRWTFRGNILIGFTTDDRSLPTLDAGCNVYMPRQAVGPIVFKVGTTGIRPEVTYRSLAAAQAVGIETTSIQLPGTFWTAGLAFKKYVTHTDPTFDLSDPLKICGVRAGPA